MSISKNHPSAALASRNHSANVRTAGASSEFAITLPGSLPPADWLEFACLIFHDFMRPPCIWAVSHWVMLKRTLRLELSRWWAIDKGRTAKSVILAGLLMAFPFVAQAERTSLSELNLSGFEQVMGEDSSATQSPFVPRPVSRDKLAVEEMQLEGTAISEGKAYALVNGHTLRLGEKVGGYKIQQIGTDFVVLQKLDHRVILRFKGDL